MSTTITISVIGATATTQFSWPLHQAAVAHETSQPEQTSNQQLSSAAQLGGVVFIDCFKAQAMPIPPKDCQLGLIPLSHVGGSIIYDRDTFKQVAESVNLYPRFYPNWQAGETEPKFGILIPVPSLL